MLLKMCVDPVCRFPSARSHAVHCIISAVGYWVGYSVNVYCFPTGFSYLRGGLLGGLLGGSLGECLLFCY